MPKPTRKPATLSTSEKPPIIEDIFTSLWNPAKRTLQRSVVTMADIDAAMARTRSTLSRDNKANFWKDITRSWDPDTVWPAAVLKEGYTGADAIGEERKAVFKFVSQYPGVVGAFPPAPEPSESLYDSAYPIQSLSLPLATRLSARFDENWLAQVAQRLSVIESHFSLVAGPLSVVEIDFVQTGMKLNKGEVDVVYTVVTGDRKEWLLSVEAKGRSEPIWLPQVARAAQALADSRAKEALPNFAGIIPFAIQVVGPSHLYTVQYEANVHDPGVYPFVIPVAQAVFDLRPAIPAMR